MKLSGLNTVVSLQIVFHYRVKGSYAVFPIDLFAFCVSPTAVGNTHLVDPTAHSGEFGGNFWLNAETIFLNLNRFDNRSFEGFIACFQVGEVEIREYV